MQPVREAACNFQRFGALNRAFEWIVGVSRFSARAHFADLNEALTA